MIDSLSYKAADFFIRNNKIRLEDRDAFAYGLRRLILNAFMLITFLFLGIITNKLIETCAFLLFFIPLRKYAGGFHFDNSISCYISSCLCVLFGVYIPICIKNIGVFCFIGFMSAIIISLLAPVQNKHKMLSANEKAAYKRVIMTLIMVDVVICTILFHFGLFKFAKLCISSMFIEFLLVIIGDFKSFLKG